MKIFFNHAFGSIATSWLTVSVVSLLAISGCATTGMGSSSKGTYRDYACTPLSPNSDIVSITAALDTHIDHPTIHIKRRGEAVGKGYYSTQYIKETGILTLSDTNEQIQCRQL